jgi:hypothetical protein
MENAQNNLDQLINKLKVLDSKIKNLESVTKDVINEVEMNYRSQLKELYQKKQEAQQKLRKIREAGDKENKQPLK